MKFPRVLPVMIGMTKTLVIIIRRAAIAGKVGVDPETDTIRAADKTPKFHTKFISQARKRAFFVAIS